MVRSWHRLTEHQIRKAELEGQFRDLPGAGKPLPAHPEEALVDTGTAVGHRIMAEAGALPEEIKLKKAVDAAKAAWQAAEDPAEKARLMAVLAELQMKYEIAREARRKFLR
ncbi:DUF1992 domain-containing protein [Maritimibacter sp. DP1N21-5]|uniref:DnaJ family domain-containing protein n=1 Tax=Maritimibacter sp. DP1N21-5 TaxID=2836867 RepID=UPI001C478EB9|nr:DUF1992 domain-containing protein [Maritimibacter sp. DP1N21-5]MBV7410572.1 DUF1992 domain-containing protein [Maritimibacter sp. DP1N21-5]